MSKSYKPKDDNYIDSTGIVHNRELLSKILDGEEIIITAGTNIKVTTFEGLKFGNFCIINGRLDAIGSVSSGSTIATLSANGKPYKNILFSGMYYRSSNNYSWYASLDQNCEIKTRTSFSSSSEIYFTLCYVAK